VETACKTWTCVGTRLQQVFAVPVYCFFKAFFELDGGFVANSFFGEIDVGN